MSGMICASIYVSVSVCVRKCVCCGVYPPLTHTGHLSDEASSGSDAAEGLP